MNKHQTLKQIFGYDTFRPGQEELIDGLLSGQDVLGVMPTGAGKSMCYQLPALLLAGITLVISPLISLMKDQVNALTQAGVAAAYLNSSLTAGQCETLLAAAQAGAYKILYVAPERLFTPRFESFARSAHIALVVVDEAHCVSQWGHDFRPSYLEISTFVAGLAGRPPLGAFTATATEQVREDIVARLRLSQPRVLVTGFDRPNLYFEVQHPKNKNKALLALVNERPGKAGIVYCATRAGVEEVCELLNAHGVPATRYHAGLGKEERQANQNDFVHDRARVMVATNAFGMGIDKSNVSFVFHYNMPKNLESYYQEAGRAGRDGEAADCILLYSGQDVRTNTFLINNNRDAGGTLSPEEQDAVRQNDLELLKQMTWYCSTTECLRRYMLRYFGEAAPIYCGKCSCCNTHYDTVDITVDAQKILSCVARIGRMGRTAGKTMVANILHGTDTIKIAQSGYEALPTYGIMAEVPVRRIVHTIEYLVGEGYLGLSGGEYPVLGLTARSAGALQGQAAIAMKLPREKAKRAANGKKAAPQAENPALYEELALLRRQLARKQNLPAYTVFADAALRDMCRKLPGTDEEFLDVSGVGEAKLKRYGEAFMQVIRRYRETAGAAVENAAAQDMQAATAKPAPAAQPAGNGAGVAPPAPPRPAKMPAVPQEAYRPWSAEEDALLAEECRRRFSVAQLARLHNRSAGAIRARMKKLGGGFH